MLFASRFALRHGLDLEIKMLGRWAVWPTMFSLFLAMVSTTWVADVLLYIGLAMTLATTAEYVVDAHRQWKEKGKPSTSA
jgi:phosphatidylglycerophosphate synthase